MGDSTKAAGKAVLIFYFQLIHRFGQGIFLVGRMEVEVDAAHGALVIALAEDDGDKFVERDAVAHSRAAAFVGRNRFFRQRLQGRFKIRRCFVHADDVFIVSF